jgi:hypothetical protein
MEKELEFSQHEVEKDFALKSQHSGCFPASLLENYVTLYPPPPIDTSCHMSLDPSLQGHQCPQEKALAWRQML